MARRILIVDGVDSDREQGLEALSAAGYEVEWAANGADGFELLMATTCDLVVMDCCLDKLCGLALATKLRAQGVKTPILVWSTLANAGSLETLLNLTAGKFVDKASPVAELVSQVDSLLKGDAPALAKTCPRLTSIEPLGAGVLLIDERDSDVEILRSMIPSSLYFDGCKSANEGLSHAHDHKFDLALFNADNAITNLTGTLAQLHLLLPDGFIVGVASVVRDADPQQALKALGSYDFDDLTIKPFKGDTVERLIGRYCSSWDDLVVVTDDLIKASPRRSRKENYKTFACNLKTRLEEGLRSLSDACFERAIVDISGADSVTTMDTAEILRRLSSQAKPLGISARFVAAPTTIAAIRKCEASFGWPAISLFPSVASARAAKA